MSNLHRDCLELMGIPLWELRRPLGALAQRPVSAPEATEPVKVMAIERRAYPFPWMETLFRDYIRRAKARR